MFKKELSDSDEITDFIVEFSVGFVDEELIRDYFFNCRAILKRVPINCLKAGMSDHHIYEKKKEAKYTKLSQATMPPLIVEKGKVLDGNHRLRVARKKGQKEIAIYEIQSL